MSRERLRLRTRVRVAAEIVRALGPLLFIELTLRTTDLPTTCRRMGFICDLADGRAPAAEEAVLPRRTRAAVLAVDALLARWPFGDTCLRRCLLLGHRLRALEPVLRIGVRRDAHGFAAHSWLELPDGTLDSTAAEYQVLGAWTQES